MTKSRSWVEAVKHLARLFRLHNNGDLTTARFVSRASGLLLAAAKSNLLSVHNGGLLLRRATNIAELPRDTQERFYSSIRSTLPGVIKMLKKELQRKRETLPGTVVRDLEDWLVLVVTQSK